RPVWIFSTACHSSPSSIHAATSVERWIMARIRHVIFYSLASLNQRIRELLERLNNKIMQKLG
ncbi:TPA: hypothetical protein ACNCHH_004897, partial [Escherichia coli]